MMNAAWLVYALVTGAFVTIACLAVDGFCRQHRFPTRWVWAAGLLATMLLSARAIIALFDAGAGAVTVAIRSTSGAVESPAVAHGLVPSLLTAVARSRAVIGELLVGATRLLPASVGQGAIVAWVVASILALLVIAAVHLRIARVRRRWPAAELHGVDVRIAPSVGPAVLGVLRPFIVVPRWLLARSDDEQRLVLAHEHEHVRAHDHLLLSIACVIAALVPWHPAVWILLARLRLAIELDCDARVLRRGIAPRVYGTLLIDLASQCSGFTVGATALADEASHLQRRLLAMKPITSRHAHLRAGSLVAVGMVAVLAACEAKVPTSAEVQNMDVAGVEKAATNVGFANKVAMDESEFFVDGRKVTAEEAHAIPSTRIATVNVIGAADGKRGVINITTGDNPGGVPMKIRMRHPATAADSAEMAKIHTEHSAEMSRTFTGVLLVDGVKVPASEMARIKPQDIASVEIVKGASALQLSNDPAAVNGVIRIVMKKGAQK